MPEQATIREVARLARVSVSTVSNVLNARPHRMRPATRRRVDRAIARLRYRPSRAARQLRTGHARTIALVVPSVANPYWGTLAVHLETAAMRHGYQVVLCNTERDRRRERAYVAGLWQDGIRDIILGSSLPSLEHIADFMARGLNVIAFGLPPGANGALPSASIAVDNHRGAVLATQHLLDLGHRRITFLSDLPQVTSRVERLRGYRDAMSRAGLPADAVLVRARGSAGGGSDAGGADGGRSAARRVLSRRPRPTAILAGNDLCALGTLAAAHELGLSVPADLSVVGFDDIALARVVTPPLTTVRQPAQTIARMAVARLVAAPSSERRPAAGGVALVVRPRLIVRSSTARASTSSSRPISRPISNGGGARGGLRDVPRVSTVRGAGGASLARAADPEAAGGRALDTR
ncbi:MAG TPA: LacI family DNA-binding transcriptional regulator [bacterium]|nr:LacI family DNA-binding transcriptional regulator [bacterium]